MPFDPRPGEDLLNLGNIQGDVLVGLQKEAQLLLGFAIQNVAAFKLFLKALAPRLTTAALALSREALLQARKAAGETGLISLIGINIGFSFTGLQTLGIADLNDIHDGSFREGLVAHAGALGDFGPGSPASAPGRPENWLVGSNANALHGLILVTGESEAAVSAAMNDIESLAGASWSLSDRDIGTGLVRFEQHGHEHFGFLDGVSQPGVRGIVGWDGGDPVFLTPQQNPGDSGQGLPGADLIWPGEFVFGYHEQLKTGGRGPRKHGGLPWMDDGTFMVFRRLRQLVPEFHAFARTEAATLGMDAGLLEARMVGRWPSGAPVVIAPLQDDPSLGDDETRNNDFGFDQDPGARRCPYAAHIRKTYPRNELLTPGPDTFEHREDSENEAETHRIMRRGIPFGPEVTDDEQQANATALPDGDRGLMFVCYQTSIKQQFELIIKAWVNNPGSPNLGDQPTGHDPLLGQNATGTRARTFRGAIPSYPTGAQSGSITLPSDFIVPTGGGYFFVPSIAAITTVLSA